MGILLVKRKSSNTSSVKHINHEKQTSLGSLELHM